VKYEPDRYMKRGFKPPSALEPAPETVNVGELRDLILKRFGDEEPEEFSSGLLQYPFSYAKRFVSR